MNSLGLERDLVSKVLALYARGPRTMNKKSWAYRHTLAIPKSGKWDRQILNELQTNGTLPLKAR